MAAAHYNLTNGSMTFDLKCSMIVPTADRHRTGGDHMYRISKVETGKKLRKLMNECGVTVRELQEQMDLESPQAVYKWLNGRALPALENLLIIGKLLHIPMEELLVFEQEGNPESEEEWNKKHPPIFMAYRLWLDQTVRKADAKRFSVLVEMMQKERMRTAKAVH